MQDERPLAADRHVKPRYRAKALLALATVAICCGIAAAPRDGDTDDRDTQHFLTLMQAWASSADTFPVYLEADAFTRETGASYSGQILATMASELGLYRKAIETWPLGPGKVRSVPAALPPDGTRAVDAAELISSLAQNRRVVIVNEAHHAAQTRVFFLDLLPRLRAAGFDWYCAETLDASDLARLQRQGYPVRKSGVYSKEPVFGEVLRGAVAAGFSLCAYESTSGDTQQARETGQAENIAKVLREHPEARVLVHAGYGHARKDVTVGDARPMAAELERLTGIDPLTVDQTTLAQLSSREREHPAYRPLLARLPPATRAGAFVDATGKPWSLEPSAYDVTVILPAPAPDHGRAGWLWEIPGKVAVTGFDAGCDGRYPCAIEARHARESADAVPADVVVHDDPREDVPALALFPGDYTLRTVAPDGARLREAPLRVAPIAQQE